MSGMIRKLKITSRSKLEIDESFELNHGAQIEAMSVDDQIILTGGTDARLVLWNIKKG